MVPLKKLGKLPGNLPEVWGPIDSSRNPPRRQRINQHDVPFIRPPPFTLPLFSHHPTDPDDQRHPPIFTPDTLTINAREKITKQTKMTTQSLSRAAALASRALRSTTTSSLSRLAPRRAAHITPLLTRTALVAAARPRSFSSTPAPPKGILPHTDDPAPPNVEDNAPKAVPAELTDGEYHEVADAYLEVILSRLEEIAEKDEGVDVEYSVRMSRKAPLVLPHNTSH